MRASPYESVTLPNQKQILIPDLHTEFVEMACITKLDLSGLNLPEKFYGSTLDSGETLVLAPQVHTQDPESGLLAAYEKFSKNPVKNWHEIRTLAAKIQFKTPDLILAVDYLLLQHKQLTIGLDAEEQVINKPMFYQEFINLITDKCQQPDLSYVAITQEVIIYLAQFCRENVNIFNDFLRLRINFIIRVIDEELFRKISSGGDQNLNSAEEPKFSLSMLSPSNLQKLVKLVITSQDFNVDFNKHTDIANSCNISKTLAVHEVEKLQHDLEVARKQPESVKQKLRASLSGDGNKSATGSDTPRASNFRRQNSRNSRKSSKNSVDGIEINSHCGPDPKTERRNSLVLNFLEIHSVANTETGSLSDLNKSEVKTPLKRQISKNIQSDCEWLRRRRLDGALNRTPKNFYYKIWRLLEKCHGLEINGNLIRNDITQQCTANELKFALIIENMLNTIKLPEYRQMIVECLVLLCSMALTTNSLCWPDNHVFNMDYILKKSEELFCQENLFFGADFEFLKKLDSKIQILDEKYNLAIEFLDSAPSGQFGTLTYIARAIAEFLSV